MAETCYLRNGRTEVILGDTEDFLRRLIEEHLGDDAARCFTSFVEEYEEELKLEREKYRDGECTADGYLEMCRDARTAFEEILTLLDAPRLNRAALKARVRRAYNDLNANL